MRTSPKKILLLWMNQRNTMRLKWQSISLQKNIRSSSNLYRLHEFSCTEKHRFSQLYFHSWRSSVLIKCQQWLLMIEVTSIWTLASLIPFSLNPWRVTQRRMQKRREYFPLIFAKLRACLLMRQCTLLIWLCFAKVLEIISSGTLQRIISWIAIYSLTVLSYPP